MFVGLSPRVPTIVKGDPKKLAQMLQNLLHVRSRLHVQSRCACVLQNAVKFTPSGGCVMMLVELATDEDRKSAAIDREELTRRNADPDAPGITFPSVTLCPHAVHENELVFVKFRVSDTGCGIPSGRLPHIFEPFMQARLVLSPRLNSASGGHKHNAASCGDRSWLNHRSATRPAAWRMYASC